MLLKKLQPIAISIFLHAGIIVVLVIAALSNPKQAPATKPIQSYLLIDLPPVEVAAEDKVPEVPERNESDNAEATPRVIEEKPSVEVSNEVQARALEVKKEVKQPEPNVDIAVQKQPSDDSAKARVTDSAADLKTSTSNVLTNNVLTNSTKFIEALNATEIEKLSRNASVEFHQAKPLIDKSKPKSRNQQLKSISPDFAPESLDVMVLGQNGPNETTIRIDGFCATLTETDLLDPITRGATLWRNGGAACRKYDKFNGQLQISLDKFLKK